MPDRYASGPVYFRHFRILIFLMILVQMAFGMIALFSAYAQLFVSTSTQTTLTEVFKVVLPTLIVTCLILSRIVLWAASAPALKKDRLLERLPVFDDAMVLCWTCLAFPNALVLIAYMLTAYKYFLFYFIGVLFFQFISLPTPKRVIKVLDLNAAQARTLLSNGSLENV